MTSTATLLEQRRNGCIEFTQQDFQALLAPNSSDVVVAAMLTTLAMSPRSDAEAFALTRAYVASGRQVRWPDATVMVDKHSTGGVGDDVSIVLAPLLAALGIPMGKVSGAALRHCGGTLDKLGCIPGLRLALSVEEFTGCVDQVGFCLAGQSTELVPADRRTYALRERTGTVDVTTLIAASIMGKKLACGAHTIALEVKHGSGALIPDAEQAIELARLMRAIGESAGRRMLISVVNASAPLAPAAGPVLELREAVAVLRGGGAPALRAHVTDLAERIVRAVDPPGTMSARARIDHAVDSGRAFETFCRYVAHLGGDLAWLCDGGLDTTTAPAVTTYRTPGAVYFAGIDAGPVGRIARALADTDPRCGVRILAEPGQRYPAGTPLLEIHTLDTATGADRIAALSHACRFRDQ
ncbi:thymidine phosphorylase [Nocardia cyriacigeorgica]|uniref:thymidine phosphorylase n=1 Tax=Nocardia TaxID=1817 RepID=UPI0018962098|nr:MULTISPECIES: thymidine phosphorylase [Nocardia]MBF6102295.1 thymidine phosphorylase [Nocardia cyriacigeorgica]